MVECTHGRSTRHLPGRARQLVAVLRVRVCFSVAWFFLISVTPKLRVSWVDRRPDAGTIRQRRSHRHTDTVTDGRCSFRGLSHGGSLSRLSLTGRDERLRTVGRFDTLQTGMEVFFVFALHALLVGAIYHTGPATRVLVRRSVAIAFVAASHELQFGIRIGYKHRKDSWLKWQLQGAMPALIQLQVGKINLFVDTCALQTCGCVCGCCSCCDCCSCSCRCCRHLWGRGCSFGCS